MCPQLMALFPFFFNATATTEIYTLSLHDALPIWHADGEHGNRKRKPENRRDHDGRRRQRDAARERATDEEQKGDRKSTRLNSSHANISYAVFCLKKKKQQKKTPSTTLLSDRFTPI